MRSVIRFIVWTAILAGCFVGLARATAIRWWQVPIDDPWLATSVSPTLRPGDWVILWRLTRPAEGALVMCPEPKAPERIVLGRVIGTSNDEVGFNQGQLRLNGHGLPTERSCDAFDVNHPKTSDPFHQGCSVEDLEGKLYQRGNAIAGLPPPSPPSVTTVDPGRYFLVSDNRQFPFDSRDYGTVESLTCKETVVFRLWGKSGYFDQQGRFEVVH